MNKLKTCLYLFNGIGWGDHFLALPFIKYHIRKYGKNSIIVITYKNHVENIFNNLDCYFVGLESPEFCFDKVKRDIITFNPDRIISFNAFYPYDFDCYVMNELDSIKYYGYYTPKGNLLRSYFENYSHIRDQYFLLAGEKAIYNKSDRCLSFSSGEELIFNRQLKRYCEFDFEKTVLIHLDSEELKLWDPKKSFDLIRKLLIDGIKVVYIGSNKNVLEPFLSKLTDVIYLENENIRFVFWLVSKSKYFIGIDSVFAHVADAYDLNGIILFSHYPSHLWSHNSKNIITIYPSPGKLTKDITYSEVKYFLENQLYNKMGLKESLPIIK